MDGKKRKRSKSRRRRAVVVLGQGRRRALIGRQTVSVLTNSFLVGAGAVGSFWSINQIPGIKDMGVWTKAGVQALIGILGMAFIPGPMIKKIMGGFVVGGAMTAIMPWVPAVKFPGTTGRPLSTDELAELSAPTMGLPIMSDDGMGSEYRGPRNYARSI